MHVRLSLLDLDFKDSVGEIQNFLIASAEHKIKAKIQFF